MSEQKYFLHVLVLCFFFFLPLLLSTHPGFQALHEVYKALQFSRSARSTCVRPLLRMTYLCQWLFSFQSEESYTGLRTFVSSSVIAKMIWGNAEAGSVYRAERHAFPLQPDLVRETGSSWLQASLGAPLCPQAWLPACLALQAGPLTGPQVIDKQIMETNKACLLSPHRDMTPSCWTHSLIDSFPAYALQSIKHAVILHCELDRVEFHVDITKAFLQAFLPLSYAWIFRLCECSAVWYWHSMEANSVKGTEESSALW